jgi:hypothetical protein
MTAITYRDDRDLPLDPLVALYRANAWSSAEKGEALRGLKSHLAPVGPGSQIEDLSG